MLGKWPLVGIAAGVLVLIVGASLVIWGVRRGGSVSVTSSMPAEMTGDSLSTTEDIDFAARTYGSVTMVDNIGTDLNIVDPDESVTAARKLNDDFL
jgi:cytosine/uracil/thiamine/allantoin permease